MKRFAHIIAACAILSPATGWAQDSGADAFAARDFATARQLWQQEADAGSAEAMLGLGLLADRGFGQSRDFGTAFDWYQQAADLGLAEAQFNVAVMYDAGLGRARDGALAQLWYTRAALRGHARAQYNLGLLFETGDGATANAALAGYWFDQAAPDIPAAAAKSMSESPAANTLSAPQVTFSSVDADMAELIWHPQTPARASYLVEVMNVPTTSENYGLPTISVTTAASGFLDQETNFDSSAVLRVSMISADGSDYIASDWSDGDKPSANAGRITLFVDEDSESMAAAADIFANDLRQAGFWVRVSPSGNTSSNDFINYGYASDAELAASVANYLPKVPHPTSLGQIANSTQPGEIIVNLAALRG